MYRFFFRLIQYFLSQGVGYNPSIAEKWRTSVIWPGSISPYFLRCVKLGSFIWIPSPSPFPRPLARCRTPPPELPHESGTVFINIERCICLALTSVLLSKLLKLCVECQLISHRIIPWHLHHFHVYEDSPLKAFIAPTLTALVVWCD